MEWRPIETAPKVGGFLVYLPEENLQLQVMYRSENGISVVGGCFAFDLTKPTYWMPLPAPPGSAAEPDHGEDLYQAERAFIAAIK